MKTPADRVEENKAIAEEDERSMDFRTFARESWFGPLDISLARLAEDDLAIGPTPIAKAPEEEFHKALSIANERHRAINWLADCSRVRYRIRGGCAEGERVPPPGWFFDLLWHNSHNRRAHHLASIQS